MDLSAYPLAQLLIIKIKRFDKSVKVLEEKKAVLKREEDLLLQLENERNVVLKHKNDKLNQLRQALDSGKPTQKIQQMKVYLDTVKEELKAKDKKVENQRNQVIQAERQLDLAKRDMFSKKKQVEKLEIHKKQWEKEYRICAEKKQETEYDELGSAKYSYQKKQQQKKIKSSS